MRKRIFAGLISVSLLISVLPNVFADGMNDTYDEIKLEINCDSELNGLTLNDGAPDGTKYYTYTTDTTSEFTGLDRLTADTYEDYMWEADVRFDSVKSGFTVKSANAKNKVDTCIRRYDGKSDNETPKLAIQTSGSGYTTYEEIDASSWYHIQLIGQYGTTAPVLMRIYKWENGEMQFVKEYDGVNKRNNSPASYIAIQPNTSIDNIRITKLGADTLTISTLPDGVAELNAGSDVTMQFAASRNGRDINKPDVEWKIFENGNEITDGSVTINSSGELKTSSECGDKNITVKVISTEKGNVEGSYDLAIKAVNLDNEKFDTLSLFAENDYVRESEPLSLTVSATKNGADVTLADDDIVWKFYNEDNIQDTGNKNIYVENNTLYVTDKVISQKIMLRAESKSGVISAKLPVTIKAADALEADETGLGDKVLLSDACEKAIEGISINSNSWDGSHYYYLSSEYDMSGVTSENEDILIEFDMQFTEENSGIKLRDSGNSKEGGQIARKGNKIGRVSSGSDFLAFVDADVDSWYHIEIISRFGSADAYAKAYIYKYDENGERVNPEDSTSNKPYEGTLNLRTMASSNKAFHHIQVQPGTGIDNMRIMRIVPDAISVTMPTDTVFAGGNVQAAYTVSRKGIEFPLYPVSKLIWTVYDSENKYPIESDLITVDANGLVKVDATAGEQLVYVRAAVTESGVYKSLPLTIKGSDIFTVTGFGINEENTAITELRVEKNFFYNSDVVFIVAMYDTNGVLMNVAVRNMRDNTLAVGENKISIDEIALPENFGSVKAMIWTSL